MHADSHLRLILPDSPQIECQDCSFFSWFLPANFTLQESKKFNARIEHRRQVKRNEYLHHAGDALKSLYAVNRGFLRTSITDGNGREQVTGFSMSGDYVGLEAIGTGRHQCDTVALEDSRLCGMRYSSFMQIARDMPALQYHFHRVMGAEIACKNESMLLRAMRAEGGVALFLLNLSKRFVARGRSGTHFRLPMTRQDIGNYLGLKEETVSRVFSHFNDIQLIAIHGRYVDIKRPVQLQQKIRDHNTRRLSALDAACGD